MGVVRDEGLPVYVPVTAARGFAAIADVGEKPRRMREGSTISGRSRTRVGFFLFLFSYSNLVIFLKINLKKCYCPFRLDNFYPQLLTSSKLLELENFSKFFSPKHISL